MKVNWRQIHSARNSFAALSAACEREGFVLNLADRPAGDVTCYSLNSMNESWYRQEISSSDDITIVGGPHASACPREVAEYADYVIVGEGEFTLPRLLSLIENGGDTNIPGVATDHFYKPPDSCVQARCVPAIFPDERLCGDHPRLPVLLQLLPDTPYFRPLHASPFDRCHSRICKPVRACPVRLVERICVRF